MNAIQKEYVVPRGEHSPLGPSSSKRWSNCPGSVEATRNAKDNESVFAAEGTAAHYLSELMRKESRAAIEYMGCVIKTGEYSFTVDEEMAASAQAFVDWCLEEPGTPLTEQRINYSRFFPPEVIAKYGEAFGTLDDARLNDDIVALTDFKHGKGVQEWAEENTQLMSQALGVLEDFGHLYDIKGFKLRICQPRLGHFDEWEISTTDLLSWALTLTFHGDAILRGARFRAGDWCKFCRIRATCAVRANSVTQLMLEPGEFEDLTQLETHALRATNRLQHLTDEQVALILPALDQFKAWIKDLEKRVMTTLMGGGKIGDWKLVQGRAAPRKFLDAAQAALKLKSLEIEPYKPQELITVADAEKQLGKKEFARRFKEGEDFVKPPGKPKLAPGDDKRPAITLDSMVEFEDLTED